MRKLPGEVGNWVEGERFWGREYELERLKELLGEGANISIIAQRRIGKTSLMRETANQLSPSFLALHLDLQDASSPADVIVELSMATLPHGKLGEKVKGFFANTLRAVTESVESVSAGEIKIQLRSDLSGGSWKEKGERVLASLAAHEQPVVLFIDELPILINRLLSGPDGAGMGRQQADALLSWLRARAIEHKGRIRMVFAGSIGLEPVLARVGLSATLNHLTPFLLEPWDDPTALGCLQALAGHKDIEIPDEAGKRMLARLGCNIPHHVQMFFSHVREHCGRNKLTVCSCDDVDELYNRKMLGIQGHAELSHMEERLRMSLDKDEFAVAGDMLTQAAVKGNVTPQQAMLICARYGIAESDQPSLMRRLFGLFEHDGYLKRTPAGYVFVSNLLKDWWRGKFEQYFETV